MFKRGRFAALAVAASSLSLVSLVQPAWSGEFVDLFKNFLINQTTGRPVDQIDQREAAVTNRIIDAINNNKLSSSQSQTLKDMLDSMKELEKTYRGTNNELDSIETATLNSELAKVETSLDQMLGSATGINTGIVPDTTDARFAELSRKITRSLANGRLTIPEVQSLKNDYERALSQKNSLKSDGVLSPEEQVTINDSLAQLERKIGSNTHDSQAWPGIDGQQALLAQRLSEGLSSGKLTQDEYNRLKNESDLIAANEARARSNGLQLNETLGLASALDSLRQRIDSSLNNSSTASTVVTPGAFDNRKNVIMPRIERGLSSGQLTRDEADDLRWSVRRLEQLESSYRSDGVLAPRELEILQSGLNRILVDLNVKLKDVANSFPEIDTKQSELRRKIDIGANSGALNSFEASKLRSTLDWIDMVESSLRQSGGTLDASEAERLNSDLDRVAAKLSRIDGGSTPAGPDIPTRKADLMNQIQKGAADGRLTSMESLTLRNEFNRINALEQQLARNGRLDRMDRTRILGELDKLSTALLQELNDGETSRSPRWHSGRNRPYR